MFQKKMDEHTKLLIEYDSGDISPQNLVDWAIHQMENGKEGNYLNELAWLLNPGYTETKELFVKSVQELGLVFPDNDTQKFLLAKKIAEKITNGTKNANEGCSEIAEISRELNSPEDISVFELLAHEQYDHEHVGITAENIKPDILEEARKLADET